MLVKEFHHSFPRLLAFRYGWIDEGLRSCYTKHSWLHSPMWSGAQASAAMPLPPLSFRRATCVLCGAHPTSGTRLTMPGWWQKPSARSRTTTTPIQACAARSSLQAAFREARFRKDQNISTGVGLEPRRWGTPRPGSGLRPITTLRKWLLISPVCPGLECGADSTRQLSQRHQ